MRFKLPLRIEYGIILVLGILLLGLISINAQDLAGPLGITRLIIGILFVCVIPGYYIQLFLFPRISQLDTLERLALSIVISLAIIPVIALLLDYLPKGLQVTNVVIAETVLIFLSAVLAALQRVRLPSTERFLLSIGIGDEDWWSEQSQFAKTLIIVIVGALVVILITGVVIATQSGPSRYLTEFYIVGDQGLAQDFPVRIRAGQTAEVIVGVENREGIGSNYQIKVEQADGTVLAQTDTFDVNNDDKLEQKINFTPTQIGDNVEIKFLLYRDNGTEIYRALRLWINIRSLSQ